MLLIQAIVSFLIGGTAITFLTLLAERSGEKLAGIIMMFPTTVALGFFFLGIATSAEQVAAAIPATLVPLGIVVCSSVIYIRAAAFYRKRIAHKQAQILAAFLTSCLIWLIIALPFALSRFQGLKLGIAGYFLLAMLAHYLLNREHSDTTIQRSAFTRRQIMLRACFVGSILALVVILGKTLSPFWGGVVTMFPAVTFSSLMILHYYYEPERLSFFMRRAPVGSLSLFVYAITAMLLFPRLGVLKGTLGSYTMSLLCSVGLACIQKYWLKL